MNRPIDDKGWWQQRLQDALKQGEIHRVVYDTDIETWNGIQNTHSHLLPKLFANFEKVKLLDAGCGYGALIPLLPDNVTYTGVDFSPAVLEVGRKMNPNFKIVEGDLLDLSRWPNRKFDFAVCRSIDGMIKEDLGIGVWRRMEKELLRVADRLILLNYTVPDLFCVIDSVGSPEVGTVNTIEMDGGKLVYRPGMDGSCEIFDLLVDESHRRRGVATAMIQKLISDTYGTIYSFSRDDNEAVHNVYKKIGGFKFIRIPGFYRGQDALMAVRKFLDRGKRHE